MSTPINLSRFSRDELVGFAQERGLPAYRGRQLFKWIFGKGVRTFDEMTDLPAGLRATLSEEATIGAIVETQRQVATDGTVKFLFQLDSGRLVESVLIPDFDDDGKASRVTVCVSSQVGCAMGCTFCATGRMGFHQNLHAGEIYGQVFALDRESLSRFERPVSNVVYMGMGEPLQNYQQVVASVALLTDPEALGMAPRRITISTVGLARRIRQLADDGLRTNLAISLHAPDDSKRSGIMPVNRTEKTDLTALRESVEYYTSRTGQPVTYEYCMFAGFNDTQLDASRLADVVAWAPSKVNLIMYNPVDGTGFKRTSEDELDRFIRALVKRRVTVTVRRSRGQDIAAACGQLAGQ